MTVFELPAWFWMGVGVSLGLVFGSFLNVVIYRVPRGESVAFPASHCTSCGAPIRVLDNLPLLGFLMLRGRARCCKAPRAPANSGRPLQPGSGTLKPHTIARMRPARSPE